MKIYFFQHAAHESPGQIEAVFREVLSELVQGEPIECSRLRTKLSFTTLLLYELTALQAQEVLKQSLNDGDFFISLGGPMSANDGLVYTWITPEIEEINRIIASQKKFLGICLGAQLLAKALGKNVRKHSHPEIGWHTVNPASNLTKSFLVYQWHYDTFEVPNQCHLLYTSKNCLNQGYFGYNRKGEVGFIGVQFHPEVDEQLLQQWLHSEDSHIEINEGLKKHGENYVQSIQEQITKTINSNNKEVLYFIIKLLLDGKMREGNSSGNCNI